MTITYTPEARDRLAADLDTHEIPADIGTEEGACSIAAVHLALTGEMSDGPIDCMSEVVRRATIVLQDAMPHEMRNSARYKDWLLKAPGTGRDREKERLSILLDWMWSVVLPQVQPLADEKGFGDEWRTMCEKRTKEAAADAADAVFAADADAVRAAADAAARTARDAANAVKDRAAFWETVDPIGVLERMTNLEAAP